VVESHPETLTNLQRCTLYTSGTIKTLLVLLVSVNTDLIIGLLKRRSLEGVRVKDRLAVRGSRLPRPVVLSAPKETVEELK
jgi:hypothetical protein